MRGEIAYEWDDGTVSYYNAYTGEYIRSETPVKTQWDTAYIDGVSEKEKEQAFSDIEDGDQLLYYRKNDKYDTIIYNKEKNELTINIQSAGGFEGGTITTDYLATETLVNIINALDSILYKRREDEK